MLNVSWIGPLLRASVLALMVMLPLGASLAAETAFEFPAGQRQLFLDDVGIAKIENLNRTIHQPAKKGTVIRPGDPHVNALQTRTAPVWDPERELWKMWDCTTPEDLHAKGNYCAGYYESPDGLHWTKPTVGLIERNGSKENNYVFIPIEDGRFARPDLVVYDAAEADPDRRYKCALPTIGFAVSPDGIHWKMLPDIAGIPSSDEWNFSLDEKERVFLLTVKVGGPNGRSVGLATSTDFKHWTNHGLIFHADTLDQKLARQNIERRLADPSLKHPYLNIPSCYGVDVYNMGLFRYEGLYIGIPAMFHHTGTVGPKWEGFAKVQLSGAPLDYISRYGDYTGFFHLELACSRDLKTWKRLAGRKPFMETSRLGAGAHDLQTIIGPSAAVVRGDELWFYYTGGKGYGVFAAADASGWKPDWYAICLAVLRRDGFISLDAGEAEGTVLTNSFKPPGGKLFVNVDAFKGELRVEALDKTGKVLAASAPMKGDLPRGEVQWRSDGIADIKGKSVSLRFTLRNGQLYSYWLQ